MAWNWRCVIERHDWREVNAPGGDKYADCTRCGRHDWQRTVPSQQETKYRGGEMPPGGANF